MNSKNIKTTVSNSGATLTKSNKETLPTKSNKEVAPTKSKYEPSPIKSGNGVAPTTSNNEAMSTTSSSQTTPPISRDQTVPTTSYNNEADPSISNNQAMPKVSYNPALRTITNDQAATTISTNDAGTTNFNTNEASTMNTSNMDASNQSAPRLIIAGTGSGAGKTTVTLGLMKAIAQRGLSVQGFKCGPDYIDPTYHTAVTGRASRNLDAWMTSPAYVRETFERASAGHDISIIEGVMGLYDGKDPLSNTGSTAEIAMVTQTPVILVVDVRSMARSAAAIVLGFQQLEPELNIAGVIVNRCGSSGHYTIVKKAIEQMCGIPVVGWLKRDEDMSIPERHLGLVPAIERGELEPLFQRAADVLLEGTDLELLLQLAASAPPLPPYSTNIAGTTNAADISNNTHIASVNDAEHVSQPTAPHIHITPDTYRPVIAVARDAAFNFYYPDNLELLEAAGARLQYFSPLAGEGIPAEADSIYLGGGFPEEFAAQIAGNERFLEGLREAARSRMPLFAECGGYMVLAETLTDREGETYTMAGIIPAQVQMQKKRAALGYREASAVQDSFLLKQGEILRGHEFHYSTMTYREEQLIPYAYETKGLRGLKQEGYASGSIVAGYTHVHLGSYPAAAQRWVEHCRVYRQNLLRLWS